MGKKVIIRIAGFLVLIAVLGLALYQPVIRPWHVRWGATDAEVQMALPGDAVVSAAASQATRAIDVNASASMVYPWLLQIGQGRGGMFSYDWLENLVGCNIHTLDYIDPKLQTLQVGDTIRLGEQDALPFYTVTLIEPNQSLVLRSVDPSTGELGSTWGFYLIEKEPGLTRLVIRHRDTPSKDATEKTVNAIFEPISFVMEHRMLHVLRDHAEKLALAAK